MIYPTHANVENGHNNGEDNTGCVNRRWEAQIDYFLNLHTLFCISVGSDDDSCICSDTEYSVLYYNNMNIS